VELCYVYLISFLSIFFCILIGKVISPFLIDKSPNQVYFSVFIDALLGITFTITLFSIFNTHFKTINTGFIVLFLALFFTKASKSYFNHKKFILNLSQMPFKGIVLCCFLTFSLNAIIKYTLIINEDLLFYLRISECLSINGKENIYNYFNNSNAVFNGTNPYHYFEFWFSSFIFKFSSGFLLNSIAFKYVCYGVLKALVILGLVSLIEVFKKITLTDCLLVVFMSLLNFEWVTRLCFNGDFPIDQSIWVRPNFITYALFLIPFFVFLLNKNHINATIFALFIPIASIITAPAIFSGISVWILCKILTKKDYLTELAILVIAAVFILIFYKLTGIQEDHLGNGSKNMHDMFAYVLSIWKSVVYYCISIPLRFLAMILLVVILTIVFVKDGNKVLFKYKDLILFSIVFSISGIVIFQLLVFIDNTYQFPYIGYVAGWMTCLFFLIFIIVNGFKQKKWFKLCTLIFFFLSGVWYLHNKIDDQLFSSKNLSEASLKQFDLSVAYIREVKMFFDTQKEVSGGFMLAEKDLEQMYGGSRYSNVYQLGSYFAFFKSNLHLLSLTDPKVLYSNFQNSPFYKKTRSFNDVLPFYRDYKKAGDQKYGTYLKLFIERNHISFLVLSPNVNINVIDSSLFGKRIVDKSTGHQFIIVKHKV
jgi:hypothetical protein